MLPGFSFYAWVPHVDPTYELLSIDVDVAVPASPGAAAVLPPVGSQFVTRFEPLNLPESQELRLVSDQISPNRV